MSALLLFTFPTTTDAIAAERFCRAAGSNGRIIPLPPRVRAGCGMAWLAPQGERALLERTLAAHGVAVDGVVCPFEP